MLTMLVFICCLSLLIVVVSLSKPDIFLIFKEEGENTARSLGETMIRMLNLVEEPENLLLLFTL